MIKPTCCPWGPIFSTEKFGTEPGVYFTRTLNHGGVMVPKELADSIGISEFGESFSYEGKTWICFEEDCHQAVPAMALYLRGKIDLSKEQIENALVLLTAVNPVYLKSISFQEWGSRGASILELKQALSETLERVDDDRKNRELDAKG